MYRSDDIEKYEGHPLETITSKTPVNESDEQRAADGQGQGSPGPGPVVHETMNPRLFMTLVCMSFLFIGSQISLYLYGSVFTLIYQDIGGADRYIWLVIGYLIPNAALCPFVGALSDLYGRQKVAIAGQIFLMIGPAITSTAHTMNIAIAGQVFSGIGAGLNELIALAGTGEVVPIKDRSFYVGIVVLTMIPFLPASLYAHWIAQAANWRYNGVFVGVWNFLGLILCIFFYKDPSRLTDNYTARDVLRKVDFIGGFLSTVGVTLLMMGLQWSSLQYTWGSAHNVVPFTLGLVFIIAFFVWEFKAPYPMCPRELFSKSKRTVIAILAITFFSGGNYFVMLLLWPSELTNVWGGDDLTIGIRTLPIGFCIIGGAAICLGLIILTKGRVRELMIFFTALMTAATGAMSIARPDNLSATLVVVVFASIGIGGILIPTSIVAQTMCPDEYIATITALTLSIRFIGGAIGFSIYTNVFSRKTAEYFTQYVAIDVLVTKSVVNFLTPDGQATIAAIATAIGNARFDEVRHILATSPSVINREAYPEILAAAQKSFALAYRYPYWISIAFGGVCFVASFFIANVRPMMTSKVSNPLKR
ncbi:MFS drug efflux pump [Pyrenophora seminiperda CCB06]|uniref:MFS drug efflux pump n=1 Tax=Pyrenophora seminiperda CCB06 TaxID=1302712 RepID=A0A3M7M815_9PLEO|nr:MFS drug efflux pump [Pyrenophora seminiperda CCB06]